MSSLRLYFSNLHPSEGSWAVDTGDPWEAKYFEKVIIRITGITVFDCTQDNEYFPRAWLEFPDGKLKIINHTAVIK